jgi:hypothetical protein
MELVDLCYYHLIRILFVSIVYLRTNQRREKKSAKMYVKAFPLAAVSTMALPLYHSR